jgi:hypothetical protein
MFFFCQNHTFSQATQAKACGYHNHYLITESGSTVAARQEGMIVATV